MAKTKQATISIDTGNRVFLETANQCTMQIQRGYASMYLHWSLQIGNDVSVIINSDFQCGIFDFLQ